jgi:hypothetical protein
VMMSIDVHIPEDGHTEAKTKEINAAAVAAIQRVGPFCTEVEEDVKSSVAAMSGIHVSSCLEMRTWSRNDPLELHAPVTRDMTL